MNAFNTKTIYLTTTNDHIVRVVEREEYSLRHLDLTVKWPNGVIAFEDRITVTMRYVPVVLPGLIQMIEAIAAAQPAVPANVKRKFAASYPVAPIGLAA